MRKQVFFIGSLILFLLAGCAPYVSYTTIDTSVDLKESNLVRVGYIISDCLIDNLRTPLNPDEVVLVACFVDVNNVQRSSSFGRMLAEHMVSRFSQNGYTVIEVKFRDSLYVKEREGEFLLSRKLRDISSAHNAQAVVVGTYLLAPNDVYLSARIVQASNARLISSCDFRMPLTDDFKTMLW